MSLFLSMTFGRLTEFDQHPVATLRMDKNHPAAVPPARVHRSETGIPGTQTGNIGTISSLRKHR
jgi:hypothetical protein